MSRAVPVTALTGHLGAGKTTVLNRLLRQPGARIGVIVNDFGAINVDAGLVTGQVDEPVSIAGGCLCCLEDVSGLDAALERLTHPRLALDAVVVEASGLAEPGALAQMIRHSQAPRVRPGGVVDVVDTVEYFRTLDDGGMPPARFSVATLVVLNKVDLLPPAEREDTLAAIEARVREVNPAAHVVRTSRGRIDPALVHDVAMSEDPPDELPLAALLRAERAAEDGAAGHDHGPQAASAAVRVDGTVDPGAVAGLLLDPPAGAYRVKGTVAVPTARGPQGYVVHVVGTQVHVAALRPPPEHSELVAIGVGLDAEAARTRLEAGLATRAEPDREGLRLLERLRRLSR
ncbi:CobW family GTP-binding protein [Nocardioides daeguensis]|uniref:GTP-binding protein n=1 Tax=Nocardioides daeguensis TaxID=908359 RepID=A0ABP6URP0_9ACTN|nr:GTP-binding protein [Nocardioides daeguensis]MBV6728703.1 GTP-binding protein [Nocardioides daeguensis]MCR1773687.1 GTP-binding protein [Nocardioides daeguensis]